MNQVTYEAMRRHHLVNADSLALVFNPLPVGFAFEPTQRPIAWSPPQNVTLPTNMADLAFYSVRDLGELIRTRQVTSMDLTRLCLARLKGYDTNLLCVITVTEELALNQAMRADAELDGPVMVELIAPDDLHRAQRAKPRVPRQPYLAVGPAADGANQFVVGDGGQVKAERRGQHFGAI